MTPSRLYLLFLLFFALAARASSGESWKTNVSDPVDRLRLILSINRSHSKIAEMNFDYPINTFAAFDPVPQLLQQLGVNAQTTNIESSPVHSLQISSLENIEYDKKKLGELREVIANAIKEFETFPLTKFETDMEAIRAIAREHVDPRVRLPELVGRYFVALPFLYSDQLEPLDDQTRARLRAELNFSDAAFFENKYIDLYKQHQLPIIQKKAENDRNAGWINGVISNHEKQFLNRQLRSAVQPIVKQGESLQTRVISIQKVPPLVSILRGPEGEDCSSLSAPYYGLIKGVDVFWIRKGNRPDGTIEGYMVVAQTRHGDKTIPSIITINGPRLSLLDVRGLAGTVATVYNAEYVATPDFSNPTSRNLVNSELIQKGLSYENAQGAEVKMPFGWDVIESYQDRHRLYTYPNYYQASTTSRVKIMKSSELTRGTSKSKVTQAVNLYSEIQDLSKTSQFERAKLAADSLQRLKDPENEAKILSALDVTPLQLKQARFVIDKNQEAVTAGQFEILAKGIGMRLSDLLLFDPLKSLNSLQQIYQQRPKLAELNEWASLFDKANKNIMKVIVESLEELAKEQSPKKWTAISGMFTQLLIAKASTPDIFQKNLNEDFDKILKASEQISDKYVEFVLKKSMTVLENSPKDTIDYLGIFKQLERRSTGMDEAVVDWFMRRSTTKRPIYLREYMTYFDKPLSRMIAKGGEKSKELAAFQKEKRYMYLNGNDTGLDNIIAASILVESDSPKRELKNLEKMMLKGYKTREHAGHTLYTVFNHLYRDISSLDVSPKVAQALLDDYPQRQELDRVSMDKETMKKLKQLSRVIPKPKTISCKSFYRSKR